MSLSSKVKEEILSNITDMLPCCKEAFLSAFFRAAGSIVINNKGLSLSVTGENAKLFDFAKDILAVVYGYVCDVRQEYNPIKKRAIYSVTVDDVDILYELNILERQEEGTRIAAGINKYAVSEPCCKQSFVKGLFVGCGTVTFPEEKKPAGYYLEFNLASEEVANDLIKLLGSVGFVFKTATRGEKTVVYVKDSGTVSDVLAYLNADKAVLYLQNMLIENNFRNNANRQSNCITANIDKAVVAAEKQTEDIKLIVEKKGWKFLSPPLTDAAKARLKNESATMEELAAMCGVTKSGINHRMRKLAEIAAKLR